MKSLVGSRSGRIELIFGLVVFAGIVGAGAAVSFYRMARTNGGLVVEPSALDFGRVWESSQFKWTVSVRNPTAEPIQVDALQTSCSCTQVEPDQFTVPAGGERLLTLTLDLSSAFGSGRPADEAAFSVELVPVVANGPSYQGWKVHGFVRRPVTFEPQQLRIELSRGGKPGEARAAVRSQVPLTQASVHAPSSFFSEVRLIETEKSRGDYELAIRTVSRIEVGTHQAEISISPVEKGRDVHARLPVVIAVVGPVSAAPGELSFGAVKRGERRAETLLIEAREPEHQFRIAEVREAGGTRTWAEDGDALSRTHRIVVETAYKTAGSQAGSMEVETEGGSGDRFTLVIPVRAYVLDLPAVALDRAPLVAPKPDSPHLPERRDVSR
ncbi:MAG: DUF1573 domain-containing protein [Planctomycetota bacterium]|nr:DUF1573 domain-containing protein [Planctomycetota bacterium]